MNSCLQCGVPIPPDANFCSQCGKKFKEPPPPTSIGAQIVVYSVSFFLPPFGLWYAYKYFKYGGATGHKIAWVAVILTAIAIGITVWATEALISSVNQSLQGFNF